MNERLSILSYKNRNEKSHIFPLIPCRFTKWHLNAVFCLRITLNDAASHATVNVQM